MDNRQKYNTGILLVKNNRKMAGAKIIAGKSNGKAVNTIPGPVFATNGSLEGEVYLQWDAIHEANHYTVEISKNGTGWQQVDIISDPYYSIQGLKSGRSYSFRISAVFSGGQSKWSEAVTKKIK